MKERLVGTIHGNSSPCFSCFTTRCLLVTAILPESSSGLIRSDRNSDGETQELSNGRSVWDALCYTTP
jgi:hypothetical protein